MAAAIALVVGLWLLARPYTGVRHDGTLYLGQALSHLVPQAFKHDFFFAFGSQDQFSLFSRVSAWLIGQFGLGWTQRVLLWTCHAALMAVAFVLTRPLNDQRLRFLGLVAVAVLPHYYGHMNMLSFGETFLTARTPAEPLALGGLLALTFDRRLLAAVLMLLAALSHPLLSLPAMTVGWLMLVLDDRRWLWGAPAVGLLAFGGALAGVQPLDRLIKAYDPVWLEAVRLANPMVFITMWHPENLVSAVLDLALIVLARRVLPAPLSRLCGAAAIAVVLLFGISLVGADAAHSILVAQLQLWRVLWIVHLLNVLFLPALLHDLWRRGEPWRPVAVAVLCAVVSCYAEWAAGWAFLLWVALLTLMAWKKAKLSPGMSRVLWWTSVVVLFGLSAALYHRHFVDLDEKGVQFGLSLHAWALANTAVVCLGFAMLWWNLSSRGPALRAAALVMSLLILGAGAAMWDRRPNWFITVEEARVGEHPFSRRIATHQQVYWPYSLPGTWAMLGRPSYFAFAQGSGLLFNRDTAIEYERRRATLAQLHLQRELCKVVGRVTGGATDDVECQPGLELLEDLCRVPRGPDFMIFPVDLKKGVVDRWAYSKPGLTDQYFYLYDCTLLR